MMIAQHYEMFCILHDLDPNNNSASIISFVSWHEEMWREYFNETDTSGLAQMLAPHQDADGQFTAEAARLVVATKLELMQRQAKYQDDFTRWLQHKVIEYHATRKEEAR
jgi:hypothetical protein